MSQLVKYVGLDVHKATIAVAVAEDGQRSEVREHGEIANTPAAMTNLPAKLGGPGVDLHICYEAGPCGYGVQSQAATAGHSCIVVVPSLIVDRRRKLDRTLSTPTSCNLLKSMGLKGSRSAPIGTPVHVKLKRKFKSLTKIRRGSAFGTDHSPSLL